MLQVNLFLGMCTHLQFVPTVTSLVVRLSKNEPCKFIEIMTIEKYQGKITFRQSNYDEDDDKNINSKFSELGMYLQDKTLTLIT